MIPFIITLTGAPASGKSYIIEKIVETSNDQKDVPFEPVPFSKYTTREYRATEIVKKKKNEFIDVISMDEIPSTCDLVYRIYGKEYGLKTKDLEEKLNQKKCPVVVINDVRAVEELKRIFDGRVLSLFLFRRVPSMNELKRESNNRGNVSEKELFERYIKATSLYRIYIENIALFDRIILNVKNENDDEYKCSRLQIRNVLKGVFDGRISLTSNYSRGAKLFIISGNNASGKDDVNLAIQKMGKLQAEIIPKYTSRRQEKEDANEMICQFTPKTELMNKFKIEYNQEYDNIYKHYSQSMPQSFIDSCKLEFKKGNNNSFDDFCNTKWDTQRLKALRNLQKPLEKFWNEQDGSNVFFENNNGYIDLDRLQKKFNLYNPTRSDEECFVGQHENFEYIIYENHAKQIKYAFSIDGVLKNMDKDQKHRVLVASFVNLIEYCKEKIESARVIPVFSYSQISQIDYDKQAKSEIEKLKSQSYDDLKRYSDNIVDFKHVIIYAETQMYNELGGQKEELIDQIFRLFKTYNKRGSI